MRILKLVFMVFSAIGIAALMLPAMALYGAWEKLQDWPYGVRLLFSEIPWGEEADRG